MSIFEKVRELFDNIVHHPDHATVTVKHGDSLWSIAKELNGGGTDTEVANIVEKISELNPDLTDRDVIHPGEELKIPLEWAK